MKYKSLPPEPTGWEPENSCAIGSDYDSDNSDYDKTSDTEEPDFDASDLDSEKSFTTIPRKSIKKMYKTKKALVVGMILQEDLCYFPE